ncbi:MAG: hypothetical protein P8Y69_00970 [Gammaproteobacteria bacterium]
MSASQYDNVIVVTRRTELDDLVARFNTKAQARFYLEHEGYCFEPLEAAHARHEVVLEAVRKAIPATVKTQVIDRGMVPRFTFSPDDLVVTVGQDGLVSNTAKYLTGQPIMAVNPDPERFDGVLRPFGVADFAEHLHLTLHGPLNVREVTLAQAESSSGQSLLAFNDFFVGARSHVSARYRIEIGGRAEDQSSSGVIVSTGAGSTGWLQSVYAGASGVIEALGGRVVPPADGGRLDWSSERLVYSVREPFPSIATRTSIVHGTFSNASPLKITSHMGANGVIFSDGVEDDYLDFNTGTELIVTTAAHRARLVVPAGWSP